MSTNGFFKRDLARMAISKKERKVIDLTAYRKKRVTYDNDIDPGPEFPSHGKIDELVRQG